MFTLALIVCGFVLCTFSVLSMPTRYMGLTISGIYSSIRADRSSRSIAATLSGFAGIVLSWWGLFRLWFG